MIVKEFSCGVAICADSCSEEAFNVTKEITGDVGLIMTDPPYGNIVKNNWDKSEDETKFVEWMLSWTNSWNRILRSGAAFYVWGGIGKTGFRPFFLYLSTVEKTAGLKLHNLITWSKKRGYGTQHNYLFCREECAMLVKGERPSKFNVPLLDELRGYDGYVNKKSKKKYVAKSPYKRRTNVWMDITEILSGKVHVAQKKQHLYEIPIEVHTDEGEYVIDMFAGSGTCALAAIDLNRKFVVIERDQATFEAMCDRITKKLL